jgi:hypothetical protein
MLNACPPAGGVCQARICDHDITAADVSFVFRSGPVPDGTLVCDAFQSTGAPLRGGQLCSPCARSCVQALTHATIACKETQLHVAPFRPCACACLWPMCDMCLFRCFVLPFFFLVDVCVSAPTTVVAQHDGTALVVPPTGAPAHTAAAFATSTTAPPDTAVVPAATAAGAADSSAAPSDTAAVPAGTTAALAATTAGAAPALGAIVSVLVAGSVTAAAAAAALTSASATTADVSAAMFAGVSIAEHLAAMRRLYAAVNPAKLVEVSVCFVCPGVRLRCAVDDVHGV